MIGDVGLSHARAWASGVMRQPLAQDENLRHFCGEITCGITELLLAFLCQRSERAIDPVIVIKNIFPVFSTFLTVNWKSAYRSLSPTPRDLSQKP